jgi:PHD/YefM family antitoxin component YafN of YafNO toxin-antitoxin module
MDVASSTADRTQPHPGSTFQGEGIQMALGTVPYIDETVEHVGVSRLRSLNATKLRNFDKTLVIQDNDKPLAVLLTYDQFMEMQKQLLALAETVTILNNQEDASALASAMEDVRAGRTKPLSEIRKALSLKRKNHE